METDVIYCDDNLPRLARLAPESVDLIYLDPPFFSNRQYEVIWGDEAEVRSFGDRWQGGINVYVNWMRERVTEMRRVLKETDSLYLHCDSHASHYMKVMLDNIFGSERFVNEIIWQRTGAHSDAKQGSRHFGRIHDVLLFYSKSDLRTWNPKHVIHDPKYIKSHYLYVDPETGRRFGLWDITGPGGAAKGNPYYEIFGVSKYWRYSQARMQDKIQQGKVIQPSPGGVPREKRYLDESPGVPIGTVWTDIPPINSQAKERLGYPTQKPEALLGRIIESSSNPGDVVLDPFAGCGTALVVAKQLGRRWIGIDISPTAVEMMRRRMAKVGAWDVKVIGLPVTIAQLRALKPFEFQNWVIQRFSGTHSPRKSGDMGIDGFSFMEHLPIQVKQSDSVGRNVVDNFETAVQRAGKSKGYIVAFSFTRGAYEEAARAKSIGLTIELTTVSDLLNGTADLVTPLPSLKQADLPLVAPRTAGALPSGEELIRSAQDSIAAYASTRPAESVRPLPQ